MNSINEIVKTQRDCFESGITRDIQFRKYQLKELKKTIIAHERDICEALKKDLNKDPFEAYATEIGIVLEEINFTLKHLSKWARPKKIKTPLAQWPSKSYRVFDPYGLTLVMAPWNYPFQLSIAPLIGSISGGNCTVLKPSNYSAATSKIIHTIIKQTFPPEYVTVIEGGREANQDLLKEKFDYIFFTGGVTVGKLVMENASKNLTPVSLELGGKSPCIVEKSASIDLAAKRIVWGKYLNAGQTCVAPDYILADESIVDKLIDRMKYYIKESFGENPIECEQLPHIITEKHFSRLKSLIDESNTKNGTLVYGGKINAETRHIEPSILLNPDEDSPVMSDEIFGPIMPIIPYKENDIKSVVDFIQKRPHPLALYLFTNSKEVERLIVTHIQYGGGCINDVVVHLATSHMPFGGVGDSGMGSYHGKESFTTFTHAKSILKKSNTIDLPVRYPPYTEKKMKLLKLFM